MRKLFFAYFILSTSCSYEKSPPASPSDSAAVRLEKAFAKLDTYPTGSTLHQKIYALKNQGVSISFFLQETAELRALSEAKTAEGYIQSSHGEYKVFLATELDETTLVHVLAHELSHVIDDHEVDQALASHPDIDQMAKSTIQHLAAGEIQTLNPANVTYVLDTLFCSEARAYTKNQLLLQEGLANEKMNLVTSQMAVHIDATYIQRYNTSFGSNSQTLLDWCLRFNSMKDIQQQLILNLNN